MAGKIKTLMNEFVGFAFKGNMLDLAVGFVIGGAFTTVVKAMVDDVVMPLINDVIMPIIQSSAEHAAKLAGTTQPTALTSYESWNWHGIMVGQFLAALLNFVILAATVFFLIVKVIGWLSKSIQKPSAPAAVTTKECPMCLSVIPIKARKCAHCTSDLPATA